MTPKQLKAFRVRLGLTQEKLGRQLEVDGRTVRRWEVGKSRIPAMIEPALNAIAAKKQT